MKLPEWTLKTVPVLIIAWFVAVVVQGIAAAHDKIYVPVDFSLSGQFGDSFGSLGVVLAAIAALGSWEAVRQQRGELSDIRAREDKNRALSQKRDFETSFFNLLSMFDRIVGEIDVGRFPFSQRTGRDAFSFFVEKLIKIREGRGIELEEAYLILYSEYQDDLAHYYRTLFNILKFAQNNCHDDCYLYIRLLRATLSEPELTMIGLNGLFHTEGRQHLRPLIEEFCLLNNLSKSARVDFEIEIGYDESAFVRK